MHRQKVLKGFNMRSIRRAALAGATAAALVLGAASAATADEGHGSDLSASMKEGLSSSKDKKDGDNDGLSATLKKLPYHIGQKLDADKGVDGRALWGSTTEANEQPAWARYMKIVTIVSLVGSFLGLVVFPAYNFAVANHLIVK